MRLGIVLDHFRRERGGTERYLAGLAQRLAARGHEVRAYCQDGFSPGRGVEIVPVATRAWSRAGREREFAARATSMARAQGCAPVLGIRHVVDVDVYQPHGGTWAASVTARLQCERTTWRRSLRAALHDVSPRQRYFARADREVFERRRGLLTLAVSPLVRDDVLARYGEFAPRVEVVRPAVDVAPVDAATRRSAREKWRARLGASRDARCLAFVAHDFELKGLRGAIEAFARSDARRDGARLIVAGRGRPGPFARQAAQLGVANAVDFVGACADVAELLAATDLLVHPTYYDPCALVTLEAMAAGVPVVTTRRNGAAPWIESGGGRVVDEPDDVAALAAAIDALLADRVRASAAAAAAGRGLGWDDHLARIEPLLERGWKSAAAGGATTAGAIAGGASTGGASTGGAV